MANNILITRNKGIQKQEILLLEFCKNTQKQKGGQREQTMSTMSTQQSTCFCCWDDLSYGLNTLGPLCLWQCLWLCHTENICTFCRFFFFFLLFKEWFLFLSAASVCSHSGRTLPYVGKVPCQTTRWPRRCLRNQTPNMNEHLERGFFFATVVPPA